MSLTKVSYSMITGAPVNVLDYGASTSASGAVNLASIQAAIDSLPVTGGSVYIPAGNYTVNGTITFPTNNIILFGDGGVGYEAITSKGTTLSFVNSTIGFDLSSASPAGTFGSEINNLLIYGSNVLIVLAKVYGYLTILFLVIFILVHLITMPLVLLELKFLEH